MALRNIVTIDENKCNGCGLCVNACAEGAIRLINGKAKLVSEIYCDGLGACIGHCPQDAITIELQEARPFDEEATKKHLAETKKQQTACFVCPGMMTAKSRDNTKSPSVTGVVSLQLTHWPIQLKLVSPNAHFFNNADLLLTADCVAFAVGDFHGRFLKGRSVVIGCPKLDDAAFYIDKLADILKANKIRSLTVIHMSVPCCFGLTRVANEAIKTSGQKMAFEDVTIDLQGNVSNIEKITPQ